jgi:hypothetical protein
MIFKLFMKSANRNKAFAVICLTFSFLFSIFSQTAAGQAKQLPEFSFKRMTDGNDFTQKNLPKGRKSFFLFFDTECPHCRVAVSTWNDNTSILAGLNAVLVTMDKPSSAVPFLQKNAGKLMAMKNLTLVQDMNRQFIARFLPKKYPSMFLFSESGALIHYTDEEKDIPSIISLIKKK